MSEQSVAGRSIEQAEALAREGAFEDALAALESVVALLEQGRLSIAESIRWYEVGLALSHRCSELLSEAELRIGTLEESFDVASRDDNGWVDVDNERMSSI